MDTDHVCLAPYIVVDAVGRGVDVVMGVQEGGFGTRGGW